MLARLDRRGIAHGEPGRGRGGDAVDVPDPDGHLLRIHTLDPGTPRPYWDHVECRWRLA